MSLQECLPVHPGITIEYLGLPGVGKSTLAHLVAVQLRAQGGKVDEATFMLDHRCSPLRRRIAKSLLAARMLMRHPGQALGWTRLIAHTRQRSWRECCHVVFNWWYICGVQQCRRRRREILLLDQGIFQALWSIAYRAGAPDNLRLAACEPLSAVLPSEMVLVVVKAGTATVAQRLRDRPESLSLLEQDTSSRDGTYRLDHALTCLSHIEDLARQYAALHGGNNRLHILAVDNSSREALPITARQIISLIQRLTAASRE